MTSVFASPLPRSTQRASVLQRTRGCRRVCIARAAPAVIDPATSIQLGTAKLPESVSKAAFLDGMYQWAATLTTSGQNLPFVLPLETNKSADGFDIRFLRIAEGTAHRVAYIDCCVEPIDEGNVFFARFRAGDNPFPDERVPEGDDKAKLEQLLEGTKDVPLIMNTMAQAIRTVAAASSNARPPSK